MIERTQKRKRDFFFSISPFSALLTRRIPFSGSSFPLNFSFSFYLWRRVRFEVDWMPLNCWILHAQTRAGREVAGKYDAPLHLPRKEDHY